MTQPSTPDGSTKERTGSDPSDARGVVMAVAGASTGIAAMAQPIPADAIGRIDIALISHAQHLDNLENEGRRMLRKLGVTLPTHSSSHSGDRSKNASGSQGVAVHRCPLLAGRGP